LFTQSGESLQQSAATRIAIRHSLIIPVYRNEENINHLIEALVELNRSIESFEVVFVVDGSPDRSADLLATLLPKVSFHWQLIELSRNFGSFAAIRQGLALARGTWLAVMGAGFLEQRGHILPFFHKLHNATFYV